jgi:hypothetical protein
VARVRGVADTLRAMRSALLPQLLDGSVIGACPVGTPDGPCGGELLTIVESQSQNWWARCQTCKTSALVDWWLAWVNPRNQNQDGRWRS